MTCAPSTDTDQPRHLPSLIGVFTVRMKKPWVLATHFVGFVVLGLNLLCKSINLKVLILSFFSCVGGARVGRGTGRMFK